MRKETLDEAGLAETKPDCGTGLSGMEPKKDFQNDVKKLIENEIV